MGRPDRAERPDEVELGSPGLGPDVVTSSFSLFTEALGEAQGSWRRVVASAATLGVPTPGFASALSYYDALRRDRLPAGLLQGLRDRFGSHTYHRVDRDGVYHTDWSGDGTESRS